MKLATAIAFAFVWLFSITAHAQQDPHHPGSFDCSAMLNSGTLFIGMAVQATSGSVTTPVSSAPAAMNNPSGCGQYTYVQVSGNYSSMTITPKFAGPNIVTSDWDCNHSMLNYAVYNADANGVYTRAGFGTLFGHIVGGVCVHEVSAAPSAGTNSVSLSPSARNPILGVYSWSHNDVKIGHPGNLCSSENCYWSSQIVVSGQPSQNAYYSNWLNVPSGDPFEPVGQHGPSFVSKKSFRIWAFTDPYDNTLWRRTWAGGSPTDWRSWSYQGQSNIATVASGCNWLGSGGVNDDRNVVVAYVGWDGKVHVGVSMGSVVDFTWSVMNDTTDNATVRPAVACGDGVLTLVVKKNNGQVAFKRNTRITPTSYSFSDWSSTWTTIPMPTTGALAGHQIAGGVAAARTSTNTVTVAASEMDSSSNGSTSCVMANIVNGSPGKWGVINSGGCSLAVASTPAMVSLDNGGARIVVMDSGARFDSTTTLLRTATTGNGTTWSSFRSGKGIVPASADCLHPTTSPAIVESKSSGEITIGAGCDSSESMRTVVIPTP